jgi:pimeloyl-ACP methyl ester carboxylesterase
MSSAENQIVSRIDATSNATESVRYLGSGADKMMASLHQPKGATHAGVVICSPILADFYTRYRHEVILGRELATRGTAVLRFHYRGAGNSDGDESQTTFDSMVADTVEAAAALRELAGVRDVTYLGTRFGALIAAAAAKVDGARTLVLWEPVTEVATYFREANRARLVQTASRGEGQGSTFEELLAQLDRGEVADILGYSLYPAFYESSSTRTLEAELGDDPRSILITQLGTKPELRKAYVALAERLQGRGHDVDTHTVSLGEPWWMNAEGWTAVESRPQAQDLIRSTTDWIAERSTATEPA